MCSFASFEKARQLPCGVWIWRGPCAKGFGWPQGGPWPIASQEMAAPGLEPQVGKVCSQLEQVNLSPIGAFDEAVPAGATWCGPEVVPGSCVQTPDLWKLRKYKQACRVTASTSGFVEAPACNLRACVRLAVR